MEEKKNHIDDYFKDHLSKLEKNPPEEVWHNVIKKLNNKRSISPVFLYSSVAAGIAVILGLSLFFHISKIYKTDIQTTAKANTKINTINKAIVKNLNYKALQRKNSITPSIKQGYYDNETREVLNSTNSYSNKKIYPENKPGIITTIQQFHSLKYNISLVESNLSFICSKKFMPEQNQDIINLPVDEIKEKLSDNSSFVSDNDNSDKPEIRRWSIQGQLAPLYAYRNLAQSGSNTSIGEYNNNENGILAYSAMVKVSYKVNNNFSLQSGLGYSMLGYTNNDVEVMSDISSDLPAHSNYVSQKIYLINSSGIIVKSNPKPNVNIFTTTTSKINGDFVQEMKYVEIPVLFRYGLPFRKISLQFTGGLATQLLISSNGYVNDNNTVTNISEQYCYH